VKNAQPPGAARAIGRASALLRSGRVVVTVVAAICAGAALAAALPQEPDSAEIRRFAQGSPLLGRISSALGLHRVVTSGWFLALVAVALASLVAVQIDQWRRVRRRWGEQFSPLRLGGTQYRKELPLAGCRRVPASPRLLVSGRLGMLGSPLFHLGLLIAVGAGLARLLLFSEAVVRLYEGEELLPSPAAYEAHRGGPLSRPFALSRSLRVSSIEVVNYESGQLERLTAQLLPAGEQAPVELAINTPLDLGAERLYLTMSHGVAALLERRTAAGLDRTVAFLEPRGQDERGRLGLEDGRELHLEAKGRRGPDRLVVRVLDQGVLAGVAELAPGDEVATRPGETLRLVGLPQWAEFRGSRDATRPIFFAGLLLGVVGVALLFGFVRVDSAVYVEGDHVVVALRAQRFAPLFAERFEQLCKEWDDQGALSSPGPGPGPGGAPAKVTPP